MCPIYEFKCSKCGKRKEELVKIGITTIDCDCGSVSTKILSSSSFVINGYNYKNGYGLKEETKK